MMHDVIFSDAGVFADVNFALYFWTVNVIPLVHVSWFVGLNKKTLPKKKKTCCLVGAAIEEIKIRYLTCKECAWKTYIEMAIISFFHGPTPPKSMRSDQCIYHL